MKTPFGRPRAAVAFAAITLVVNLLSGCFRSEIVLVDRATALEYQARGSFAELERKLLREVVAAHGVALTPDELHALGIRPPPLVDDIDLTEADRVDALLAQRCIGEALDGLLADTHDTCRVSADRAAARALIERVNRARQQLWRWMQARQPKVAPEELRRGWRQTHLRGVVCGGWLQRDDGTWESKPC